MPKPRSPKDEFVAHCCELFEPAGRPRARRMFGGHGLYLDELFVAIVQGGDLWLKTDAATRERFAAAGSREFLYDTARGQRVSLGYFSAPQDAIESPAAMQPWLRLAVEAALRARARKR